MKELRMSITRVKIIGDKDLPIRATWCAQWAVTEPIEEHSCGRRREKDGDPLGPAWTEAKVPHLLKQEWPGDRVEHFGDVEFEKHSRNLEVVGEARRLLHEQQVAMDVATGDEGTLVGRDNRRQARCQPYGMSLHEQLSQKVDQADMVKLEESLCIQFLREQGNERLVQLVEAVTIERVELPKPSQMSCLMISHALLNSEVKPSRPGALRTVSA